MTEPLASSASTSSPGNRPRRATRSTRSATVRRWASGTAFVSERYNLKEAAALCGAVGAVSERIADPDRHDQPQHAPPDGHGRVRPDDAEPHRRPVRPRDRPGHPGRCRTSTACRHHDRADGGLRRDHAAAVPRRGDLRPRRPGRVVAGAAPRRDARRAPADGLVAFGPETLEARRPVLRRGRAAHLLHRRDHRARASHGQGRRRGRPAAIPTTCSCGRASRPSATTSPSRSGS